MERADLSNLPVDGASKPRVAWVFAAGPDAAMPDWPWLPRPDLVVAADGGLARALDLGQTPAVTLGDFDSLASGALDAFAAAEAGATEIVLTGVLGGRWDHSLANLLLLSHPLLARVPARLVTADTEVFLLRGRVIAQAQGRPGDTVSLLPLTVAEGVTLSGMQYPLLEETLYAGFGRAVSNVLSRRLASVSLREGLVWLVVTHATAG